MTNSQPETDLIRLFAEVGEPGQGDVFVKRVSRRIALLRCAHLVMKIFLAGVVIAILAFLTPWVMGSTDYVALGLNILANGVMAVIFSPVGCVLGGAAGLFVFLRIRS